MSPLGFFSLYRAIPYMELLPRMTAMPEDSEKSPAALNALRSAAMSEPRNVWRGTLVASPTSTWLVALSISAITLRLPRISRLMVLAIHMQDLVDRGEATSHPELARLAHVFRPRITQIMNLTPLAPDIQEAILFLPPTRGRRASIRQRHVRPICVVPDWGKQRKMWEG